MLWAIRQILVPCNYLRIRQGVSLLQSKAVFDWVFPVILTAATVGACLWLCLPLAVFKHAALLGRLQGLLALMIVFFMAALAAVATYDREGIDVPLRGGDATLKVRHHGEGGKWVPKPLTYRKFISYLFGYLSFLSLCLYLVLTMLRAVWSRIEDAVVGTKFGWIFPQILDPVIFVVVFLALWQLVFTSFLGIYFLTERIQTLNDPEH